MDHLDRPSQETWDSRREWFESRLEPPHDAGYIVGEQAAALTADVESAFCAGAWLAVLVLATAVVEAQIREGEPEAAGGSLAQMIDNLGEAELHWLRRRRNELVHVRAANPAVTVDDQWVSRDAFEADARRAVELMVKVLFLSPWV